MVLLNAPGDGEESGSDPAGVDAGSPDRERHREDPAPDRASGASRSRAPFLRLLGLALLVGVGIALYVWTPVGDYLGREGIGDGIEELRGNPWAPVIFVLAYAAATALAVPGTVLTLAGGALFGVFWGTVYNSLGANLGANLAFLEARWLGREGVQRLVAGRLERFDRATRDHGFRGLLTLRLVPLVPFNALNFGSGLTRMTWRAYALATAIGILPATVVYTMFADALLQGSQEASREALLRVALSGALLLFLAFLPTILKKMNVRLPGSAALVLMAVALPGAGGQAEPSLIRILHEVPDHSAFTEVLEEVVHLPRIDYEAVVRLRPELDAYLDELAGTDPDLLGAAPRSVRMAFWINAYNACMLRLVADHYPIERASSLRTRLRNRVAGRPENSVWQIEGVFDQPHCRVAASERSQDEIEHEIIRPMGDPRIHFAVNCAARSCPSLAPEAYRPATLEAQLDDAAERFLNDPRHFRPLPDEGVVRLNRVLDWYGEDFGGEDGIKRFLASYVDPDLRSFLLAPSTGVEYVEYDWTLNDVER